MSSLVIVDARVQDYERLLAGLGSDFEIVVLDPSRDGMAQIVSALDGANDLDAIHIISHGSEGTLYLGSTVLTESTLPEYTTELSIVGTSLTETGDILLYGCNVASGQVGQSFIDQLARVTGAEVAASADLTGADSIGGDWVLEVSTGPIDASSIVGPASYSQVLLASGLPIRLPFDSNGLAIAVTQEPGDPGSHTGVLYTSWDFALPYGHAVLAVAGGIVVDVRETVPDGGSIALPNMDGDGNPLNDDSSLGSGGIGNLVTIRHTVNGQTFYATYMHLQANSLPLEIGDTVQTGQVIGLVGNTGSRDGTHLHFQVGSSSTLFGYTNYGNGSGDNAKPQTIANASEFEVGLVSFAGYGTDLPATVIGPPATLPAGTSIVSISDAQVTEGNSGTKVMTFTVTRTGGTGAFDVSYTTQDGSAEVLANDYVATSGTLHFDANVNQQTINVTINGDAKAEGNETLYVVLSGPINGAAIENGVGVGAISNDDFMVGSIPIRQSYSGKAPGEWMSVFEFAALRADGSVVGWGLDVAPDGSSSGGTQIDGTVDVVEVFSSHLAFAALRVDGSLVTWGQIDYGGDSSAVVGQIDGTVDVVGVFSTVDAFAALRVDGSVVTWGHSDHGGDSSAVASQIDGTVGVVEVFSTQKAFAALRVDGSVVTWGHSDHGGDSSAVASEIDGTVDVVEVFATDFAFAALRVDGSVVTWGPSNHGGDSSAVASEIDGTVDVIEVFSTTSAFAALRVDGSVVTWGWTPSGGDSSAVAGQIDGTMEVVDVFSSHHAFAALRGDGSVVTWGHSDHGGDSSAVANRINGSLDVVEVFSTASAFAALRVDGSVVTWGDSNNGGDSSAVAIQIDGTVDVVEVFSNPFAFAALRVDGSVVTWGDSNNGGDSSAVAIQIDGTVDVVEVFSNRFAFAALRVDGSVVTWGNSSVGGANSSGVASQIDGNIDVISMATPFSKVIPPTPDNLDDYADEATDTTAPIGLLNLGSPLTAVIGPADTNDTYGDKDVFKVLLTQGQSYQIRMQSTLVDGEALPQGIFTVRDPGNFGTVRATSAIGSNVAITFTADTTGYHYIRTGTGGAATDEGGYQLSVNNLSAWTITSPQSSVLENSGTVTFTVTRPSSSGGQTVYVSTTTAEGYTNTSDYTPKIDEPLIFLDGQQSKTVTVTITPDTTPEPNQTFGLIVQQAPNPNPEVFLAKKTFTILNDDNAGWSISTTTPTVNEDVGTITFTVTRPADGQTQTVYLTTLDDQGSPNVSDYGNRTGVPVTFAGNETVSQPITVQIYNDTWQENTETFRVIVKQSPGDSSNMAIASATFTITDDDAIPAPEPSLLTDSEIFAQVGGELYFLALMSEAAYRLRETGNAATNEPTSYSLNDGEHSDAAAGEYDIVDNYLQLLTTADLPGLALSNVGGAFPYAGLGTEVQGGSGIYTNGNAAALVGRADNALFIAFRGTNDDAGIAETIASILAGAGTPDSDHWFDNPILNGGLPTFSDEGMREHYELLAPLIDAIDVYIGNPANGIDKVYVTGHSLGAAMAQAYMHAHELDNDFKAYTFADVGYEGFEGLSLNFTDARITSLLIEGDPVAGMGDLFNPKGGDTYLIDLVDDARDSKYHSMDAYLAVAEYLRDYSVAVPLANYATNSAFDKISIPVSLYENGANEWVAEPIGGSIFGTKSVDFIRAAYGNDYIYGGGGGDFLYAGDGPDSVFGESGPDSIISGSGGGNDHYDGGPDVDTIIYASTSRGITVNLSLPQDQGVGPEIDIDQIINIENVVGGGGNDLIIGNGVANVLDGGSGEDTLEGGGGNDTLIGGDGNDNLIGKQGADYAAYVSSAAGVTVNLAQSGPQNTVGAGADVLSSIENLSGSNFDDVLSGNAGGNELRGLEGNDALSGLGGAGQADR